VLRAVLGDYATHAAASTFMAQENDGRPRSDLLALKGARLVTATETEDNRRLAEGLVKASTGGDPITCRGLYREEETFLPSHMPVLATNHRPIIRGMDLAIWRRILLWPFEVTIPEKDRVPGYERELMAEGSGILNWLLEGLRRYQEAGRLAIPAKVRAATDQYRSDMDRLGPFLSEYFTSDPWPEDASRDVKCSKKEFSDLYKLWCTKYGVRIPLTDHQVKSTLEERGVESKRGEKGTHYWIGIRPKSADEIINDREEDGQ
jgi:putative DNA primase/helicase